MEGETNTADNEAAASLVTRNIDRFWRSEDLFPGIPNEVTLKEICTKMSCSSLHALSSVNRTWRQVIQSRLIYDTRVHSHGTETLVVLDHSHSRMTNRVALYSLRDKAFYQLPPIPGVNCGIPNRCQCIGFDGKIYILGGMVRGKGVIDKVYVLDLVGQSQWKECASMKEPRRSSACGLMNGKIYIFGCSFGSRTSEVYDPKTDAWSAIKLMTSELQQHNQAVNVGEELFLLDNNKPCAYHPVKDEWRTLPPKDFGIYHPGVKMFVTQGKLHVMNRSQIGVYDFDTNSWRRLHSCSFAGIPECIVRINAVLPVDGELVAVVYLEDQLGGRLSTRRCLIQSRRFGSKDREIVWHKAQCLLPSERYSRFSTVICPLQL